MRGPSHSCRSRPKRLARGMTGRRTSWSKRYLNVQLLPYMSGYLCHRAPRSLALADVHRIGSVLHSLNLVNGLHRQRMPATAVFAWTSMFAAAELTSTTGILRPQQDVSCLVLACCYFTYRFIAVRCLLLSDSALEVDVDDVSKPKRRVLDKLRVRVVAACRKASECGAQPAPLDPLSTVMTPHLTMSEVSGMHFPSSYDGLWSV